MIKYTKVQWDNYRICSVMARVYLAVIAWLFIMIKDSSYTGWDYITFEFYLMAGLPLVGIVLLTIYFNMAPSARPKNIFQVISVIVLMAGLGTQILVIIGLLSVPGFFPLNLVFGLIAATFIFCTAYTIIGIIQKKL